MDPDDPERKQLRRDLAESHGNLGAFAMDLGRPPMAYAGLVPTVARRDGYPLGVPASDDRAFAPMSKAATVALLSARNGARQVAQPSPVGLGRTTFEVRPEGVVRTRFHARFPPSWSTVCTIPATAHGAPPGALPAAFPTASPSAAQAEAAARRPASSGAMAS